ncbi:MAG TPA: HemK2/MTQ2 family protein methyltransferase [Thermoplasmata archaeon]|nr:HemK2/MTQ2 family protein methyltransferase [Thermoplasmata archaeon]
MRLDPGIAIGEGAGVYRPSDDSYLLMAGIAVAPGERFLEVGTGTGLIALHAARLTSAVATDADPRAAALAAANARRNELGLDVVRCDLMAAVRGPFDVVAFNPPYLEGRATDEEGRAWHGGEAGSEVAMRFLRDLPRVLAPGGRAYLLLSRANGPAWEFAESRFEARVLLSKALFFERLDVLELREPTE